MRLLFLLLFFTSHAFPQICSEIIEGSVEDFHDGSKLIGATIVVVGIEKFTQTDLNGNFRLENICLGTYTLQVSHPECSTKIVQITVPYNGKLTIKLEHHLEELDQVTVKGSAGIDHVTTQLENKIGRDQLESLSFVNLGDALKLLSGVSSLNTGSTVVKPVIQGLHSSRVVIMNNGVRMQDQEWGAEHAPNVDLNSAGSISVIKGASALQYGGDAVGGIVLVEPERIIKKDSLFGKTILTGATNGRGGTLTSSITKTYKNGWYAGAQGTLKRFGDFETPNYVLSNTAMFEKDASFRFGVNKFTYGFEGYYSFFQNELGILRASHIGGADDQFRAITSNRPLVINDFTYAIDNPKQEVTHHLAKVKIFRRITNFGKLEAQYDFQFNNRLEFDVRRGGRGDKPAVDLELTTHSFTSDLSFDAHPKLKGNTGVLLRYQNNYANPETGVRRLIPDYDKLDAAIYALGKYQVNDFWTLEAGFRYDYNHIDANKFYRKSLWLSRGYDIEFSEIVVEDFGNQILTNPVFNYHNFSGTAGFSYSFLKNYKLLANYSLATRAPNPSELFSEGLHHSASRIELGDIRFTQEIANKFSVALEKKEDNFSFTLNPYLNNIQNFILLEPIGIEQTIRGNFQVWAFRQTDATLFGIDIDAFVKLDNHFSVNTKFSLVKGNDTKTNEALIQMPPANLATFFHYKNEKWKNLNISLESNYVFRQNEYPETNFELFLPSTNSFVIVDLSTPPDAYHLFHFNADADFKVLDKSVINIGLTINNILDTEYRDYLNRLRYYADDLGRNIIVRLKMNY
ncbi:MAG: TonB-dependent receptor [Bacteroidetes bacterium HGW-Bacteroidetes-2]|jgi:iron complex outermembrane receptor protein|nr:MAG: TonB-dependent receptor [Bacteroidetes bacterium HGW-Bacteroidetes-2]